MDVTRQNILNDFTFYIKKINNEIVVSEKEMNNIINYSFELGSRYKTDLRPIIKYINAVTTNDKGIT